MNNEAGIGEDFAFAAWFRGHCERYGFIYECGGWECQHCRSEYIEMKLLPNQGINAK